MPVSTQGSLLGGRYLVLRHLGSGGMASVLLCHDQRLDRRVAVKRLHADSPEEVERRFVREAKLGASLNHPNLVSVFDTEVDDEGVLIVMEYVDGEPLSRVLRRGPLEPERVARMARDLGGALDHAHAHGVVHRDVKPGNVLLRRDGVTKLADLGIATASDQTRITRSGTVLGTAAYMAPEQLDGGESGPAADVYALAAVCFEALAGARARPGRTPMEIARRIAVEPPPDLRDRAPGLPRTAADALMRGMARDPMDRQRSAGELARELARALEEGEAPTQPTRPVAYAHHDGRGGRLARGGAVALALLALVAAAVAGVTLLSGGDGADEPQRAERPRSERAKPQKQNEPQAPAAREQEPEPSPPAPAAEPEQQPSEQEPAEEQPSPSGGTSGAELNDQGFALMQQGNYAAAIPILQQAVEAFPAGTTDLTYAYALYNLGRSLRLAGRPEEAIPILEQRLQIPNQTETVRRELEAAKRDAGRG